MASFRIAWQISASYEGVWNSKPERGSEGEEYIYGAFWGTNFGLTGRYVKEFAGFKANQRAQFQNMSGAEAGEVWKNTRWRWMQGEAIQNQEIANLLFDWSVRRWNSLIKGVATVLNVPITSIAKAVKNTSVGGIPTGKNDGFYVFTPALAALINKHQNPRQLHTELKNMRKRLDNPSTPSIVARYNAFNFDNTTPKPGGVLAYKNIVVNTQKAPNPGGNTNVLLLVGAGLLLYKMSR